MHNVTQIRCRFVFFVENHLAGFVSDTSPPPSPEGFILSWVLMENGHCVQIKPSEFGWRTPLYCTSGVKHFCESFSQNLFISQEAQGKPLNLKNLGCFFGSRFYPYKSEENCSFAVQNGYQTCILQSQ